MKVNKHSYQELPDYSHLIAGSAGTIVRTQYGGLAETIKEIQIVALESKHQVKDLAAHLYSEDLEQAAYNVWHWNFHNLQYHLDRPNFEQIRTPARTYQDGNKRTFSKGVDCEDLSIFAHCLLSNMGYNPIFHIVAFNGKLNYGHIYIKVGGFAIDPCPPLREFNQEAPNITKTMQIDTMAGVEAMAGLGAAPTSLSTIKAQHSALTLARDSGKASPADEKMLRKLEYIKRLTGTPELPVALRLMPLVEDISPRGNFVFKPGVSVQTAAEYASLQYLREKGVLEKLDNAPALSGLSGLGTLGMLAEIDQQVEQLSNPNTILGLGSLDGFFKKLTKSVSSGFKKVTGAVKSVAKKATKPGAKFVKKIAKGAAKAGKAVVKTAAKAGKAVAKGVVKAAKFAAQVVKDPLYVLNKLNPATILIRNAFLLALRVNLFKMAQRLKYGYLSEAQAAAKGMDLAEWRNLVDKKDKVENTFHKLGGERSNVRSAVLKGGGGLSGLGEPVTAGSTAAASGVIATVTAWLKKINFGKLFAKAKGVADAAEIISAAGTDPQNTPLEDGSYLDTSGAGEGEIYAESDGSTPYARTTGEGGRSGENSNMPMILAGGAVLAYVAVNSKK